MDTGGCLSLQIVFKRLSSRSRYGRPTVESALRLDIDAMMRWGGIRPERGSRGVSQAVAAWRCRRQRMSK